MLLSPQQAFDLAMSHHREGRLVEAENLYRQLHAIFPDSADVQHLLGVVAQHSGDFPAALAWMQGSIALAPGVARYINNLGLLFLDWQRGDEAVEALQTARDLEPGNAEIHYNLGLACQQRGQWEAALTAYGRALQIQPDYLKAWLNLGAVQSAAGLPADALATCREALRHCPGHAAPAINLGSLLKDAGRLDEAIEVFQTALAGHPNDAFLWNNLGTTLKDAGEIAEAVVALRRSVALAPASAEMHSNLLFTLLFDPAATPQELREEQQSWNTRHAVPLRPERLPHPNDRSPDRRLRIGYVSSDLRAHVVGRTLLPVFEAHDRTQVECWCYGGPVVDAVSERFRAGAAGWRDVQSLTDAQLAAQIRADGIDILVDLSLHTAFHRLLTFARQPAPVQVSWLGYPGSTGLETIAAVLTDRFLDPPGQATAAAEELLVRLPDAWCCYPAPDASPEVNELPALSAGWITFGSFNNFAKINDRVLELWARLLHAVPDSRLRLLAKAGQHLERVRNFMAARDVSPERLEILGYEPNSPHRDPADFLRRYHAVDIALDPFPYNGMTTTGDALWMGVPVVARRGASSTSRASFSLLSNLGLPELAASTEEDYVHLATALAHDLPRLAHLRATLRPRMKNSPLLDAAGFARHLENAWREMWHRWVRTA